jgi:hypothetical protein
VTAESGVENGEGKSLGIAVGDFNDDGWPDLVVANDTQPNFLYVNQGDGTFFDEALFSGIAFDESGRARAGMGIDVADLENNGKLAVGIGNFSREPVSIYCQETGLFLKDITGRAGLTRPTLLSLTFGLLFIDMDMDTRLDLLLANGHIEPDISKVQRDIRFEQPPQFFLQGEDGRFIDVSEEVGQDFQQPLIGRGLAWGDFDRDGDPDLVFTSNNGRPVLFRNDGAASHGWLRVRLRGSSPNVHALGAHVEVRCACGVQQRWMRTGSSYLSQSEFPMLFGLGSCAAADEVRVKWPDGKISTIDQVAGELEISAGG